MKIARKVLSIVLSIAMILSTIAVATVSSFAGTALNVSMTLTATPVSIESDWDEETGEIYDLYYTFYDEDGEEIEEPEDLEKSGEIDVEPGQDFIIRFYASSDYYVDSVQALVYAPIELLDTAQVVGEDYRAFADTKGLSNTDIEDQVRSFMFLCNTYTTGSGSRLKYFSENSWIQSCMISSNKFTDAAFNTLLYQGLAAEAEEINANNSKNTADGTPYFTYTYGPDKTLGYSTIEGDSAKYGSNFMFLTGQNILKAAKLDGEDPHLCEFPIHIPSDAPAGATYKVFIPSQNIRSAKNPDGKVFATISGSTTYDPKDWQAYSADQVWDLSGATLTFKVPGETPSLEWDALQDAYDTAIGLDEDDYTTSSWDVSGIEDAIADAAEALDNQETFEGDQDDIDALTDALTDAMNALDERVDATKLEAALFAAYNVNKENYKDDEFMEAFETAVSTGEELMEDAADTSADYQEDFDNAADAITEAIKNLTPLGADYTAYNAAIAEADRVIAEEESWYTAESFTAYKNAVDAQRDIAKDLPITEQKTVDDAKDAIIAAKNLLIDALANYEPLTKALAEAAELNELDYTAATWKDLADAVTAGNEVAETIGILAKNQKIIDDAADAIAQAIIALDPAYASTEELAGVVATAAALNLDWYEDGMAKGYFQSALEAAQAILRDTPAEGYPGSYQATIDSAKSELEDTMGSLSMKFADYSEVHEAIAAADALDKTLYTEASLDVLANAILAVKDNLTIDKQDEVDKMAKDINDAIYALVYKDADYTALDAEIATSDAITDSTAYTVESWAKFDAARTAAKAVERNKDITYQETIDAAKDALENARKGLVGVGDADYSKLNAAIAEADKKVQTNYTTATWVPFNNAKNAAKAIEPGLNASHQGEIDAAERTLTEAMNALVPVKANTTALEAAVEAANTKIANAYKYVSVEALETLVGTVRKDYNYTIFEQDIVDQLAGDINTAIEALEWAKYVPTEEQESKYAQMADDIAKGLSDYYTTATWNDAKAKFDAINPDWTYKDEATAGRAWDEFEGAFDDLAEAKAANYDAVDAQIAIADGLNSAHYTWQSWSNLETAIDAVERGLNENHQAEVDKMATDIAQAIADLVPYANYGLLDALILDAEEVMDGEDYINDNYTEATKDAFDTAYDEAVALSRFITEDQQDIVDQAANKLDNAMQALTLKGADYTALDAKILEAKAINPAPYTTASYAKLTAAVQEAEQVSRKLTIKEQGTVDNLTDKIEAAIKGLVEQHPSDETDVTLVTTTAAPIYQATDYNVTITGRAIKFQFVDAKGSTWTFDRNSIPAENIVSYDKDGNVVDSKARNIDHEVWTVNVFLRAGDYKVVAKYSGTGWQTDDAKNYDLTVAYAVGDVKFVSAELAATSGPAGRVAATVVTGKDVQKVQLVMNGTTNTVSDYSVDGDGNHVFNCTAFAVKGENSIIVKIKYNNEWFTVGDPLTYTAE